MRHGNLTRNEAIELAGVAAVEDLDAVDCQPTGRVQCDGDTDVEYAASIGIPDPEGYYDGDDTRTLTAYYYTTPSDMDAIAAAGGDESVIDWVIHGYEID